MAYQSWSVVFGEQPSAAKWNIIGTNMAGFNDGTAIGTGVLSTQIATNGVAASQLATTAIALAFTTATTTTGITAAADITASSTAVTIPAGGRRVMIHAWCQVSAASANTGPSLSINAAGSDVSTNSIFMGTGGTGNYIMTTWVETPAAGSRTYKLRGSSNNATSFSSPFMLIMVI